MPRYRWTGAHGAVLLGLSHGVNATVHRERDSDLEPDGSTVVIEPGEELTTVEPYRHLLLERLDGTDEDDAAAGDDDANTTTSDEEQS